MMKLRSCDHEEYSCSCEWTSIPMLEDSTNPAAWFPFEPPPDHFGLETAPCSCCGAGFSGWPPQVHTPLQRLENDQVAAAAACFNTTLGGDGDDLAFLDALGNAPPAADQSFMCCSSAAAAGISNDNYFYCGDSVLIPDPSSFVDGDFPIDYDVFDDQLPNPPPAADS
ncbi:unnamed protein product [Cuscuta europaea]|uniref:Uncharacterized protein n=1 Tax=Cuscuta europaea TaxID=41803 RepID=A0A9P0ZXT1_CUSEU|nr:unnamed protein product [Cuscuta europaea]